MGRSKKRKRSKETFPEFIARITQKIYAGIDEVGVGSIAGPMVASVVILPVEHGINDLPRDSKELNEDSITRIAKEIYDKAIFHYTSILDNTEVNKLGIDEARMRLWIDCATKVRQCYPDIRIIIDGKDQIEGFEFQNAIVQADSICANVSAAAIISKNYTNRLMKEYHKQYPVYNFAKNKGYPVPEHYQALKKYGPCPLHREEMTRIFMSQQPKQTSMNLSLNELTALLNEVSAYLRKDIKLAKERFELPFMCDMYIRVCKHKKLPTPKQQYYIVECHKRIIERGKRKYPELAEQLAMTES